jgi:hypothetical protein
MRWMISVFSILLILGITALSTIARTNDDQAHKMIETGDKMIAEGHAQMIEGNEMMSRGHKQMLKGEEKLLAGYQKMLSGRQLMEKGQEMLQTKSDQMISSGDDLLVKSREMMNSQTVKQTAVQKLTIEDKTRPSPQKKDANLKASPEKQEKKITSHEMMVKSQSASKVKGQKRTVKRIWARD